MCWSSCSILPTSDKNMWTVWKRTHLSQYENYSSFCPHSAFMDFVWIWEQTAIISLCSINLLVYKNQSVNYTVSPVSVIPTVLHNLLHLHTTLTGRKNGELRDLPNAMLFRNSGSTKYKSTCTFLLVFNGSNTTKTVFPDHQRNQVTVLASRQSTHSAMQDRPTFLLLLQPQELFRCTRNRQLTPSLSERNLVLLWHVDVPTLKWCISQREWTIWPDNLRATPRGLVWGRRSGGY